MATGCQNAETPHRFSAFDTSPSRQAPKIVRPMPPRPRPSDAPPTIDALYVLGVQARVWSSDDDPRFEVTMNMALDPAQ